VTSEFLTLGWAAIDWIEHYLVHGPGDVQGQPIELDDEYAAFIIKAYRVVPKSGEKLVRRAFLSRPKGRAKSELAGMLDCFEALGPCRFDHWAQAGEVSGWGYEYEPGEPVGRSLAYAEILNVATEEGQAGNTYDNAHYMLHPDTCSAYMLADYGRIDVGLTRTNLPDRRGFIEPVTAANDSKDGGKSTFIVADETHLWIPPSSPTSKFKLGLMHQTMARNLLKRKLASGWMLETSTMYAAGENSVAEGTHAYAKSTAGRGGKLLFDHRQASDGYNLPKRSERVRALREAYGPAAAWMPLGEIADSYDDPQVDKREWERFWLNRPVPLTDELPDPRAATLRLLWPGLKVSADSGVPPVCGFGVDVSPDWTAASIAAAGLRADERRLVWVVAAQRGTGWILPKLVELRDTKGLTQVSVDARSETKALIPLIEAAGIEVVPVTTPAMGTACGQLLHAVKRGELAHLDDPLLNAALAAAEVKDIGTEGAWILTRKGAGNITPLVAGTLAFAASYDTAPAFLAAWR
jgi:hypothetical protein